MNLLLRTQRVNMRYEETRKMRLSWILRCRPDEVDHVLELLGREKIHDVMTT